jgi:DHA1 family tetracycline resistance protein-like MFS transporter
MQPNASSTPLKLIFVTLLIDVMGIGIIIPILPQLLKTLGGYSLSEASSMGAWMLFAFAFPQFLFSPLMGNLSDRFGRRPIIIIALLGMGLDYFFHALAWSIPVLFVGRVIAGICGASFTTASSYIADVSTPEKRTQNFGLIGMAFGLGFILGPVLGGLVAGISTQAPFILAGTLSVANALLCYFYLPESLSNEHRRAFDWKRANPLGAIKQIKQYQYVLKLIGPFFVLQLASHAVQSNWSYYTKFKFQWDEKMIGLSLGMVGLMVSIVQGGLIRVIIPKLGNLKAIQLGFVFFTIGMFLFGYTTQGYWMFGITAVYCMGGIAGPAIQGEMSHSIPANAQGELSGIVTSAMSITGILGPLIMNNLFAYFTQDNAPVILPAAPMYLGAVLMAIAGIWISIVLKQQAKQSV